MLRSLPTLKARLQHRRAGARRATARAIHAHAAVAAERDVVVGRAGDPRQPARHFRPQRAQRRIAHGAAFEAGRRARIGLELQALETADEMALDRHLAVFGDAREQRVLALQALQQRAGAAVDEALRQRFVQRVGELVLDLARLHAPVFGVFQPIGAARGVGPGADVREARLQRVEIAGGAIELLDLGARPIGSARGPSGARM